ncbi:hypothetical protein D9613_008775 [Agrocybe pediades]|uniref:Pyruvate carboxylase n=1 Tax=Agrocybe pediades TaxID=84607 RepID=A0A8H4QTN2_9AGAR|nr:hypothetical protein D9613_008775 [Agrocybe pediades]
MPKVLVANRGEIAIRVLRAASELGWDTVALYTENDFSHDTFADQAIKLNTPADYLNVEAIVKAAVNAQCTHIHPGYGFLSESPALPLALDSSITYIGPSPSTLRIASDKMLSRDLADSLNIPIAPGRRVQSAHEAQDFARSIGYPVIIKALDGGGGRGIRIVNEEGSLEEAFKRCLGESPSKQLFVEKALTGPGWKHVEVQIIGDGTDVNHLWERECSVQRRFQKIVEIAPSHLSREDVRPLLDASLKMAKKLQYKGLGTFEFLVNVDTPRRQWVFLEINPRVQVEHTVTGKTFEAPLNQRSVDALSTIEEITGVDLVRAQILLFSPNNKVTLSDLSLLNPPPPPKGHAIQLRITAEDPEKGFQLSPGTLRGRDVNWPGGRGVRVDTWLTSAPIDGTEEPQWTIGTEFDSLLAKIITKGATFEEATEKAKRSLRELRLGGTNGTSKLKTNIAVLLGMLLHHDWRAAGGTIDTLWLERNLATVLQLGSNSTTKARRRPKGLDASVQSTYLPDPGSSPGSGKNNVLLQPGSLFHLTLSTPGQTASQSTKKHAITLTTIGQNAFPEALSGSFQSTFLDSKPIEFTLTQSTSASISSSGDFELADPNDPMHVGAPMTGKIVELHAALREAQAPSTDDGKRRTLVRKGEPVLVFSVMKMENVIVSPCDGYVRRVGAGVRAGVIIGEGTLICVLEERNTSRL